MKLLRTFPIVVLILMAVTNIVRGCIHTFAPDGGAHSIAGLDISQSGQIILSLFAAVGLHQLVLAGFQLFVLVWRRDLLLIALVLQLANTALGVINLYCYRTMPVAVPGAPFNAVVLVVLIAAVIIAERDTVRK